jgi:hypothetical protein
MTSRETLLAILNDAETYMHFNRPPDSGSCGDGSFDRKAEAINRERYEAKRALIRKLRMAFDA